ncbi:MAG: SAM-dependent methyltransferase [Gammaproteobacteria bacterium]|nr:SAM-dependent methyltransferase [Gammaproteobacteria bacterium]MDH3551299.1 SAM-dependent methyltransferase [Gammaproteobacteria bacterium]
MRRLFFATLLVSAAAIGYEILLMRVLSIVQWHHFAYMIISLALLGYGASGTFIALLRTQLEQRFEIAFAVSALSFSVAMLVCFIVGQRVPFNALEIIWDWREFVHLSLIYVIFFVPFFFAACCIGLAFTCRRDDISRIYFFDLAGAGLGAVLIIVVLFAVFPQNAILVLVALAVVASALVGLASGARKSLATLQLAWLVFIVFGLPEQWLTLRLSEYKGLSQAMQVVDARTLSALSSPLGLLTVVDSPTVPFRHAPGLSLGTRHVPPEQLAVFTDGDSISAITRYDGNLDKLAYLDDVTAALPYRLLDSPRVLVLGAGAGTDVLLALRNGTSHVDAVELNPQMTELVRETYADFSGHLYEDPRVSVHTREARGFVMQTDGHYDLIQIGLLDSFGASGAGVQALNESYLYTVEGLQAYVERLEAGGILSITRWLKLPPRDGLKLFATAVEALRRAGVERPDQRLAMIRSWNTSTLLVKNGEFSAADIATIREFARARSLDTAYFPGIAASEANRFNLLEQASLHDGAVAFLGGDAEEFFRRYKFHIEPATDDQPYFFHFFKWASFREVIDLRKRGGAGLIEWGYLILVATLAQAVLAGLVLILMPLAHIKRTWPAGTGGPMGSYFFLLGLAFLFVEIAFIQKFILFLSHPLYSVAVVLSGFLVFAGIGSAMSARLTRRAPVTTVTAVIAAITLAYVFLLPVVFQRFIGLADTAKIAMSIVLIAPLAFCMGMPFPLGLKRLADRAPDFIPWAWGINGFASVLSAALATLMAIEFGFSVVLVTALLFYVGAAILIQQFNETAGD